KIAKANFPEAPATRRVAAGECLAALLKLGTGGLLLWFVLPRQPDLPPLLTGWLGMIGIILMLHFGLFHLLSMMLRRAGCNAPHMMRAPILADSIADFWGRRWNQPFHELTIRHVFNPLRRRCGPGAALFLCFVASGLLHDLIITVPAGGGYGLPTVYFVLQGAGLLAERRLFNRGTAGARALRRAFTWLIVAGPVGLLFPPVFVERIIMPMLHAIGAH
ncbi:MAG TPA: hypothetical protein DCY13_15310, partial [Verrucomicrobiales bacterium]|nr:hypothetical protein [Verrucomicrobiales bacterium]